MYWVRKVPVQRKDSWKFSCCNSHDVKVFDEDDISLYPSPIPNGLFLSPTRPVGRWLTLSHSKSSCVLTEGRNSTSRHPLSIWEMWPWVYALPAEWTLQNFFLPWPLFVSFTKWNKLAELWGSHEIGNVKGCVRLGTPCSWPKLLPPRSHLWSPPLGWSRHPQVSVLSVTGYSLLRLPWSNSETS